MYIFVLLYITFVKTIDFLPFRIHSFIQLNLANAYFVPGRDTMDEVKKQKQKQKRHDHHPCEANSLKETYK